MPMRRSERRAGSPRSRSSSPRPEPTRILARPASPRPEADWPRGAAPPGAARDDAERRGERGASLRPASPEPSAAALAEWGAARKP